MADKFMSVKVNGVDQFRTYHYDVGNPMFSKPFCEVPTLTPDLRNGEKIIMTVSGEIEIYSENQNDHNQN